MSANHQSPASSLARAVRGVWAPLAELLISRGVGFPKASEQLKRAFLDAAQRQDGKLTVSRLSVLTGLQRRDVKALLAEETAPDNANAGPLPRVLARWAGDPTYLDDKGAPLVLPRREAGDGPSFEGLCRAISQDVHPRTVLDLLSAAGAVTFDEQADLVTLVSAAFTPADEGQALDYLGRNLGDHAEAAVANVLSEGEPPFFERALHYNGLTPASAAQLDAQARRLASTMLNVLNQEALRLQEQDAGDPEASERIRVGVYIRTAEDKEPEE